MDLSDINSFDETWTHGYFSPLEEDSKEKYVETGQKFLTFLIRLDQHKFLKEDLAQTLQIFKLDPNCENLQLLLCKVFSPFDKDEGRTNHPTGNFILLSCQAKLQNYSLTLLNHRLVHLIHLIRLVTFKRLQDEAGERQEILQMIRIK